MGQHVHGRKEPEQDNRHQGLDAQQQKIQVEGILREDQFVGQSHDDARRTVREQGQDSPLVDCTGVEEFHSESSEALGRQVSHAKVRIK